MPSRSDTSQPAVAARPCPICKAPIADPGGGPPSKFRPFCSRACADIDLLRWLRGAYVVPGTGTEDDEDGETGRPAAPPPATAAGDPVDRDR